MLEIESTGVLKMKDQRQKYDTKTKDLSLRMRLTLQIPDKFKCFGEICGNHTLDHCSVSYWPSCEKCLGINLIQGQEGFLFQTVVLVEKWLEAFKWS